MKHYELFVWCYVGESSRDSGKEMEGDFEDDEAAMAAFTASQAPETTFLKQAYDKIEFTVTCENRLVDRWVWHKPQKQGLVMIDGSWFLL